MKKEFPSIKTIKRSVFASKEILNKIKKDRRIISDILSGSDKRKLIIVGPCSIHNTDEAIKYAKKLKNWAIDKQDKIFVLMRVCCDKPRTKKDWRGLFNDPDLNGTFNIEKGVKISRKLILDINKLGLPVACEALNPYYWGFIQDLISYSWVGARTVTSPDTREMASGFEMPVGIKNSNQEDGIDSVINAIKVISEPTTMLGINDCGRISKILTGGAEFPHVILRGGKNGPNYNSEIVNNVARKLKNQKINPLVIIDCSHGNSAGDYRNQITVLDSISKQIKDNNSAIVGLMLESYLDDGKQDGSNLGKKKKIKLKPNLSVTDACLGWENTEKALNNFYLKLD